MVLDDLIAKTNDEKCELFARHFASVFRDPKTITSTLHLDSVPSDLVDINTFAISREMIEKAAQKLKSSFSPGPNGIPAAVLKRCVDQLIVPLLAIFNLSMRQAKFPTAWKKLCFLFSKRDQSVLLKTTGASLHYALAPNFWKSSLVM